jgi:hypothetical protein
MARRLTVSASIDGVDDETFGSNEYGRVSQVRETILADSVPQMFSLWSVDGEESVGLNLI